MFTDARISTALETMVRGIDVPPVRLTDILGRVPLEQSAARHVAPPPRLAIAAAAVIAVVAITVPAVAPGFAQSVEARIEAILQWKPPPSPPDSLLLAMRAQTASLSAAQSKVRFTIVPPSGLPNDVVSAKISTAPTGTYSKSTHSWHVGPVAVTFSYRRANGRSFDVMADEFDSQTGPPAKYIFEDRGTAPDGHEILVKHEQFAWRSGNQETWVVEDNGINATEIRAIQAAMHGIALPRAETRAQLNMGTKVRMYKLSRP